MATKDLMGSVPSMRRWQKRCRGRLFAVPPRQLGGDQRPIIAVHAPAKQWREEKRAVIDAATGTRDTRSRHGGVKLEAKELNIIT